MIELGKYVNAHSCANKIRRLLWGIVWRCLVRPTPRWCLNCWRIFWLRLFGAKIGHDCRVQGSAEIWAPWNFSLGDNSWIDGNVKVYCVDKIAIGSNAVVSAESFLCTAGHDIGSENFALKTGPIEIGACAWIASRAIVLPGRVIGEGAVVAAGAVVVHDVEPWTVVGGNPAETVGKRALH